MKKIIAVLLTVCLCAAAFAACGKENASYNINDVSAAVEKAVTIETPIAFSEDDLKLDMSMDMANVEEYQCTVLYMISDASSYMTGSTVIVDGGRTCW